MKKAIARLIILAIAVVTLGTTASVSAQSNGLGITPRKDYTVKAGEKVTDQLFVSNLSQKEDLRVSIRIVDFKAQDESGTPALELSQTAEPTPWSLRPFVKVDKSVTVKAGKSAFVPFTVEIPAKQGAGSYYSAVEYVAENATTQQKVNISASSATLVFVTVPGQAHEQLLFKQFGTFVPAKNGQNGTFQSFFSSTRPELLAYRLENRGNVAEQPQGTILVKNIFGKTVYTVSKANPKNQLALRGQTRRFETCIKSPQGSQNTQLNTKANCEKPKFLPGRYTAQLAVFYGLNGNQTQEIAATASFWYLPWWSIVIFAAIVLLLAVGIWLLIRKLRGRKKGQGLPAKAPTPPVAPNEPTSPTNPTESQQPTTPTPPSSSTPPSVPES